MTPYEEWDNVESRLEALLETIKKKGLDFAGGARNILNFCIEIEREAEHVSVTFIYRGDDEVDLLFHTRKVGDARLFARVVGSVWDYEWR